MALVEFMPTNQWGSLYIFDPIFTKHRPSFVWLPHTKFCQTLLLPS